MPADYPGPADRLAAYERMVAAVDDTERKGAKNPYTSLNGHMTSFLDAEGTVGLRLSAADREAFIAQHDSSLAVQYGRTMREFVVVPGTLLDDTEAVAAWFARGLAWVATLTPKPTTR